MSRQKHVELPNEGTRCLAAPTGRWAPGRIQRVNEDGTFTVELDENDMIILPYWYGVTSDQISINDEAYWPDIFERLTYGSSRMTRATFADSLSRAGYRIDEHQLGEFWSHHCKDLFDIESAAEAALNEEQVYLLLLRAGSSAKQFTQEDRSEVDYYKLYWNQIRMGGRQPSEISRSVTLDDAFGALGIPQSTINAASAAHIHTFQRHNQVEIPSNLRKLLCCASISDAVLRSHPNNPELVLPEDEDFELQNHPPLGTTKADYALPIMFPHQGNHVWVAVFDRGDTDARVYVTLDHANWLLTSPTIGMFFWDLAQTGLIWYQNTGHDGGKPIDKTDIGVIPAQQSA